MQPATEVRLTAPFASFDFVSRSLVAVAVSGGSDSTAALLILRDHLLAVQGSARILALTVDHGLRAGSHDEAVEVGRLCARLGIDHRILSWSGHKPRTGLLAAAREARYDLLAAAAQAAGTDMLVTGHTLDDQMETVTMRRARGPGIGLAGMAPVTLFDGRLWIARPLLGLTREVLRSFLIERAVEWTDDPTNADTRFERPRLRAGADSAAGDDGGAAAIAAAGQGREDLSLAAAALVRNHAGLPRPGLIHLAPAFLAQSAIDARVHALRILLAVSGGSAHLPEESRTAALLERLADPPHRATLSRALVLSRRDGVWMCRETRGLPQGDTLRDGMVWDGRYRLRLARPVSVAEVASAGPESAPAPEAHPDLPSLSVRAAAAAMPLVRPHWDSDANRAATQPGHGANVSVTPVAAPWARYLSGFDLAVARAVSRLIGAPDIPPPPWRGHIVTRA